MKSLNSVIKTGIATCMAALMCNGYAADKPFGSTEDVKYAQQLWKLMEDRKLVGEGSIKVEPFKGNEPHGTIQEVLSTQATIDGHIGKLIVKRNHGGKKDLTVKEVYDDPEKYLAAVTIMFEREKGYDTDNLDWFWAKYKVDGVLDVNPKGTPLAGRVAKGASEGCIACHTALGGKDMQVLTSK